MLKDKIDILVQLLEEIKSESKCEVIKAYFESPNNYCIKLIENGKNHFVFRERTAGVSYNFDSKRN